MGPDTIPSLRVVCSKWALSQATLCAKTNFSILILMIQFCFDDIFLFCPFTYAPIWTLYPIKTSINLHLAGNVLNSRAIVTCQILINVLNIHSAGSVVSRTHSQPPRAVSFISLPSLSDAFASYIKEIWISRGQKIWTLKHSWGTRKAEDGGPIVFLWSYEISFQCHDLQKHIHLLVCLWNSVRETSMICPLSASR